MRYNPTISVIEKVVIIDRLSLENWKKQIRLISNADKTIGNFKSCNIKSWNLLIFLLGTIILNRLIFVIVNLGTELTK